MVACYPARFEFVRVLTVTVPISVCILAWRKNSGNNVTLNNLILGGTRRCKLAPLAVFRVSQIKKQMSGVLSLIGRLPTIRLCNKSVSDLQPTAVSQSDRGCSFRHLCLFILFFFTHDHICILMKLFVCNII